MARVATECVSFFSLLVVCVWVHHHSPLNLRLAGAFFFLITMRVDADYLAKKYPDVAEDIYSLAKSAPKRLLYAIKLQETHGNQTQAYMAVYGVQDPNRAGSNASTALRDQRVSRIVERISHSETAAIIEDIEFSKAKIMEDLERGKEKALEINQIGPFMRGCELQGKELGMFVDRSEQIHRVDDSQLFEQLAALAPDLVEGAKRALALPGEAVSHIESEKIDDK